jgi:hypothetical protein
MRVLAFSRENYPSEFPASYVLMHHSMALEELGHEVHLYNIRRRPMRLSDYLQAFEFGLIIIEAELLDVDEIWRTLRQHRRVEPVRVVASVNRLPMPPDGPAWDVVDLVITPWKGETVDKLASNRPVKYLPLGYSSRLHKRESALPPLGPVFVGNTTADRAKEAGEYLGDVSAERVVLCIGPGFEQKSLDPLMLGPVYAAARCLPNFHYSWEKGTDRILNERFWQTARCGLPVNDFSTIMTEVWDRTLLEQFAFADKRHWQDRIRSLHSGTTTVDAATLARLNDSMIRHSYTERMKTLLVWLE